VSGVRNQESEDGYVASGVGSEGSSVRCQKVRRSCMGRAMQPARPANISASFTVAHARTEYNPKLPHPPPGHRRDPCPCLRRDRSTEQSVTRSVSTSCTVSSHRRQFATAPGCGFPLGRARGPARRAVRMLATGLPGCLTRGRAPFRNHGRQRTDTASARDTQGLAVRRESSLRGTIPWNAYYGPSLGVRSAPGRASSPGAFRRDVPVRIEPAGGTVGSEGVRQGTFVGPGSRQYADEGGSGGRGGG